MIPDRLFETFTPDESAFQCEDEEITIIPNQSMKSIPIPGKKLPALRPLYETKVPLWVALLLKKQGRCKVKFPEWLQQDNLVKYVDSERQRAEFSSLPWSWQVIARLLLEEAADDLDGDVDVVREHIKDLSELRQVKIRAGVTQALNESQMSMNGMGILELNEVRPVLSTSMLALHKLSES